MKTPTSRPPGFMDHGVDSLMDELLVIRGDFLAGRLHMYIGEPDVRAMNGYMLGFLAGLGARGVSDERYPRFKEWLRVIKGEFPPEGWHVKYLRDCNGDHVRAIKKLLDFAAEFHAMELHARS